MVTEERAEEILGQNTLDRDSPIDGTLAGLNLLSKLVQNMDVLQAAEHDEIFSHSTDITLPLMSEEDVIQLGKWGWNISQECWHKFV